MKLTIKKSDYLAPKCEVIAIESEQDILTGSVTTTAEEMEEKDGVW